MMITSIKNNDISQIMNKQIEQFGRFHILIDPKLNDDFFFENDFNFESIVPIRDRQDTVSNDHECIQLCTILKGQPYLDEIILGLVNPQSPLIGILFSSYSIQDIQKQISNAMFMYYDGKYYFLRCYDPLVLRHLATIFDEQQLHKVLGVIEYWYYWNETLIELHHRPEKILTDIDYKITKKQWYNLNIAQAYNAYEYQTIKQQNKSLTVMQQTTLQQLLEWVYTATYNQPDKNKLNGIVHYAMGNTQSFIEKVDYDLLSNMMKNNDNNQINYYLNNIKERI